MAHEPDNAALRPPQATERIFYDRLNSVAGTAVTHLRVLSRSLAPYREPNHGRSVVEILITVVPFVGLWSLMWLALHIGYGLYSLLAIPTAGFLVRLFMIQHDLGGVFDSAIYIFYRNPEPITTFAQFRGNSFATNALNSAWTSFARRPSHP